ncbi:hypothetical protein E2C01_060051 [Portunus trituberculatus]|uniref:Uncharacterized protein n=1 Tax=Portunus trituberculatus TaxID=210409 RepID=A0A5B7H724_PORTR|nr:hypothetical protein [Portunus trituberculatus]
MIRGKLPSHVVDPEADGGEGSPHPYLVPALGLLSSEHDTFRRHELPATSLYRQLSVESSNQVYLPATSPAPRSLLIASRHHSGGNVSCLGLCYGEGDAVTARLPTQGPLPPPISSYNRNQRVHSPCTTITHQLPCLHMPITLVACLAEVAVAALS